MSHNGMASIKLPVMNWKRGEIFRVRSEGTGENHAEL